MGYCEAKALILLDRSTTSHFCAHPLCTGTPKQQHLVALNVNHVSLSAFLPVCVEHQEWLEKEVLTPNSETKIEGEAG